MKHWIIYAAAGASVTAALHLLASMPWGWAALAAFVGWPLIGTLITIDDDLPGGFSNHDGSVRPEWLQTPFWARVVLGLGIAATVAALETGLTSSPGLFFGGSALVAFAVASSLALWARARST